MAVSGVSAATTTETNFPVVINGYVCFSAADVKAARTSVDPQQAEKAEEAARAEKAAAAKASEARHTRETTSDTQPSTTQTADTTRDVNRPLDSGIRGTLINILA